MSLSQKPNKIPRNASVRRIIAGLSALWLLCLPLTASAVTLLSQGYTSDAKISSGAIVSLKKGSTDQISIATTQVVNSLLGVAVHDNNSQLTLNTSTKQQVQVATDGVVPVLVSDINGEINEGDSITISPIQGVGMKATSNTKVVGVSQDKFPNSTTSKQGYKDSKGQNKEVNIGEVSVQVNVTNFYKQPDKTIIPSAIQNVANALAGKPANTVPIIASIVIFIVTITVVVSIIYSMIRSSIVSVGRNPMAQSAIYRNIIQLSVLVLVILGVAVVAIYMVLKKF